MNHKDENPNNLGGLGDLLPTDMLKELKDYKGSIVLNIYERGSQHIDTQINMGDPPPTPPEREGRKEETLPHPGLTPNPRPPLTPPKGGEEKTEVLSSDEAIRNSIALLMQEKYGEEPLFNQQNHWQAVYRILVDKGYCRDSDFDGFDTFIHTVIPEEVNKPYSKGSLKQISQTDFVRPFNEWRYDVQTSKTRKPFDRMVAVARRFLEILEENSMASFH